MHTETAKDFSDECDRLLSGLEHFRDGAMAARNTLHLPPDRSVGKSGMPVRPPSASHPRSQVLVTVKGRPGECPRSIKRLCVSAAEAKSEVSARISTPFLSPPRPAPRQQYVPEKPLLIRHWNGGQIYEVSVITTESLLVRDWTEPGDAVFSWSSIFRPASPFHLVSTNRTFKNWKFSLRSRNTGEIRSSIDGWLAAELARNIKPWDEERANAVRSLIELRYEWTDAFVRLRPVTLTTDELPVGAGAESLQRSPCRLVGQNPSRPAGPTSHPRNVHNAR
ncbi:hypothetical protein QF025_000858 [Paraburkholderia graminis]|uniref:Integrase catalytic region n=1 Tax=Paraburkholderia graminis TaxID=60548 RepID=A0ABD5CAR6_9BURK|nr:hypothetical protein [Paraburkholderia graminis]